jgi:hypothetical protein
MLRPGRLETGGSLRDVFLFVQQHFALVTNIWNWIIRPGSEVGRKEMAPATAERYAHLISSCVALGQRRSRTRTPDIDCLSAHTGSEGHTPSAILLLFRIPS